MAYLIPSAPHVHSGDQVRNLLGTQELELLVILNYCFLQIIEVLYLLLYSLGNLI